MDMIVGIVIGVVVGWVFPQPAWAKPMIDWVMNKFKKSE